MAKKLIISHGWFIGQENFVTWEFIGDGGESSSWENLLFPKSLPFGRKVYYPSIKKIIYRNQLTKICQEKFVIFGSCHPGNLWS